MGVMLRPLSPARQNLQALSLSQPVSWHALLWLFGLMESLNLDDVHPAPYVPYIKMEDRGSEGEDTDSDAEEEETRCYNSGHDPPVAAHLYGMRTDIEYFLKHWPDDVGVVSVYGIPPDCILDEPKLSVFSNLTSLKLDVMESYDSIRLILGTRICHQLLCIQFYHVKVYYIFPEDFDVFLVRRAISHDRLEHFEPPELYEEAEPRRDLVELTRAYTAVYTESELNAAQLEWGVPPGPLPRTLLFSNITWHV
ncbi:hypothetical protein JCM10908_005169 [Rhodotorula pacifica]|uniref:uncharacterized protein n=1 Tax=Rhodotorula pacifica TaxID=1495444 RepID=UPI00316FF4E1